MLKKHKVDISTMFQAADDVLFRTILSNKSHVLYTYLSERLEIAYSLRTRNYNKFLIPKTSDLGARQFIIALYKNLNPVYTSNNVEATGNKVASCFDIVAGVDRAVCRCDFTNQIYMSLSLCTICHHIILLYVYVYELCTQ